MTTKTDGGRAFPWCGDLNECPTINLGMSLRDYFAAKAMPVVWADIPEDVNRDFALDALGKRAYEMADAMLKAREQDRRDAE